MPKINQEEFDSQNAKILSAIGAGGAREVEISKTTGIHRRTVNNHLRRLIDQFKVIKRGIKYYLVSDPETGEFVSGLVTARTLEKMRAVNKMIDDGINPEKALSYLGMDNSLYRASLMCREISDALSVHSTKKGWLIMSKHTPEVGVILKKKTGSSGANVKSRITKEILPLALTTGSDKAIKSWLRHKLETALGKEKNG